MEHIKDFSKLDCTRAELQIRGGIMDSSKIIFLVS